MRRQIAVLLLAVCLGHADKSLAGTFIGSDQIDPFIVVHPQHYNGTGGPIHLRVCADSETVIATLKAIDTWNALQGTTENCTACRTWEQGPSGSGAPSSMSTVMLHEMGHCAMGLGHINWNDGVMDTSFTSGADVGLYTDGVDGVRGSSDDGVSPPAGARATHWFRTSDNDPFTIDATTIDISTYTRRKIDLPAGHTWPASGNLDVGNFLGLTNTQAVMYSLIDESQRYHSLAADEVNTVEFGMSGLDETAGTADDYTIVLEYVASCASADIEVRFIPLGGDGLLGRCLADLTSLTPMTLLEIHFSLTPVAGESRLIIEINSDEYWDIVFGDGFETGTTSEWSQTVLGRSPRVSNNL